MHGPRQLGRAALLAAATLLALAPGVPALAAAEGPPAGALGPAEARSPVAADEAAPGPGALLDAGREALHAGRHADAAARLEEAIAGGLDGAGLADARQLLGRALVEVGAYRKATAVLERALEAAARPGGTSLTDRLRWSLAEARAALGEHRRAAELYARVADDPWTPLRMEAAYRRAAELERAEAPEEAAAAWRRFLAAWPDAPLGGEARVRLAALEAAAGQVRTAIARYREVVRVAPGSRAGLQAGLALEALGAAGYASAVEPDAATVLADLAWRVDERRFAEALPQLEAFRDEARAAGRRADALRAEEFIAFALRESGRLEEALAAYEALEARGRRPGGATRTAWLLARLGRHRAAERELLRAHAGRKSAGWWEDVGDLRVAFGRYKQAEAAYRRALRYRRGSAWLERRLAWCVLRQGRTDEALRLLDRVASRQGRLAHWARYWKARALQDAGRTEEARGRFAALASAAPFDYHGILAASRLAELEGRAPRPRGPEGLDPGLVADALAPLADAAPADGPQFGASVHWPPETREAAFGQAPRPAPREAQLAALAALADAYGDVAPEARRALELARLGFTDAAAEELRVVDTDRRLVLWRGWRGVSRRARVDLLDNRSDKRARGGAELSDAPRRSPAEARRFARAAVGSDLLARLRDAQTALADPYALRRRVMERGGLDDVPDETALADWRAAYPIAWPGAVAAFSRAHGVPPYLLYGVMTVESAFHAHAVSVSYAYGVLQVIPRTGRRVAEELAYGEFSPELLLEPEVGIYLGSHYLGRLLRRFRGQEPLAAAAYNAGPHRVAEWLDANPDRPLDAFLEEIPFRQARRYVRRVLEHTARYRRAYHGEASMYVSNVLDAAHGDEPAY